MYAAAMTLGVNNGEERLNNLYCMGADAKINKAEILNWILWSHKYTSSPGSWSVSSHECFCCVRIQNIFTCESFANFLTAYKSGVRPTDRHLMENKIWRLFHAEPELLFQISPDGVKRGHFAQIDTLTMDIPFVTSRTCTHFIFLWMSVHILWSLLAIFHRWSLARVWQHSGGGNRLERSTYRHYWKFRARSELNLTLPINISHCSTNAKQ